MARAKIGTHKIRFNCSKCGKLCEQNYQRLCRQCRNKDDKERKVYLQHCRDFLRYLVTQDYNTRNKLLDQFRITGEFPDNIFSREYKAVK